MRISGVGFLEIVFLAGSFGCGQPTGQPDVSPATLRSSQPMLVCPADGSLIDGYWQAQGPTGPVGPEWWLLDQGQEVFVTTPTDQILHYAWAERAGMTYLTKMDQTSHQITIGKLSADFATMVMERWDDCQLTEAITLENTLPPQATPQCTTIDDCDVNEDCRNGWCMGTCGGAVNCTPGLRCVRGLCEVAPACPTNGDRINGYWQTVSLTGPEGVGPIMEVTNHGQYVTVAAGGGVLDRFTFAWQDEFSIGRLQWDGDFSLGFLSFDNNGLSMQVWSNCQITSTRDYARLGRLVINEVDYDEASTDETEFIEIFNAGGLPVPLANVQVELVNGNDGSIYGTFLLTNNSEQLTELPAGGYLVLGDIDNPAFHTMPAGTPVISLGTYTNSNIQNGAPDGLRLVFDDSVTREILDGVHYEGTMVGVGEGTSAGADTYEGDDQSLGRCPNGADTDDNGADFVLSLPSPGDPNNCL